MAQNSSTPGTSEDTKTIVTVLLLVFVFPIGVILMWFWTKWPLWVKILITVPILILPLIVILAAVVVLIINPVELTKRSRDAARLSDLANLQKEIDVIQIQAKNPTNLCGTNPIPCKADSYTNPVGWVKVDLAKMGSKLTTLPIDPVNSKVLNYSYCSDGKDWEIEAKLESKQQQPKMVNDGGVDPNMYEVGSKFGLCPLSI